MDDDYFRRWAEMMAPMLKFQQDLERFGNLGPDYEYLRILDDSPFQRAMKEMEARTQWNRSIMEAIEQQNRTWQTLVQPYLDMQKQLDALKSALPDVSTLQHWLDALDDRDLLAFNDASARGWFVQPEFIDEAADAILETETGDQLDAWFERQLDSCLDAIQQRVITYAPARAAVLNEAFENLRAGRYVSAVPLLLMMAEGVAVAATRRSPFNTDHRLPELAKWIEGQTVPRQLLATVLQLSWANPFVVPVQGLVNRHRVLHGADLEFGTRQSALRAVSFLGSLAYALDSLGSMQPN